MNQPNDQWQQWNQQGPQQPQWYPSAGEHQNQPAPGSYGVPSRPVPENQAVPPGFQSSSYGGFGAFTNEPQQKRGKKPLLVAVIAVVVLAGGSVAGWLLGAFDGDVLDQRSLQDGVTKVLSESYGEKDVRNVDCPDRQTIETGHEFTCTVDVAGKPKKVKIRVLNTKPEFEVGAPS